MLGKIENATELVTFSREADWRNSWASFYAERRGAAGGEMFEWLIFCLQTHSQTERTEKCFWERSIILNGNLYLNLKYLDSDDVTTIFTISGNEG